jgi:hypothetical protein
VSNNWFTYLNILEKRLYQPIIARLNGDRIESQGYQKNIIELVKRGLAGSFCLAVKRIRIIFYQSEIPVVFILYLQGTARYMNLLL